MAEYSARGIQTAYYLLEVRFLMPKKVLDVKEDISEPSAVEFVLFIDLIFWLSRRAVTTQMDNSIYLS